MDGLDVKKRRLPLLGDVLERAERALAAEPAAARAG